jgi:hypothetical protein
MFPIKISAPVYTCVLPSTNAKVEFRPYLVKEEKLLLIANESNNPEQILMTTKQTLQECTFGKLNIDSLPIFDIEYLYLMIRARSKGEEIVLNVTCNSIIKATETEPERQCKTVNKIGFNIIYDTKIKRDPEHKNKIEISEGTFVLLKYPEFSYTQEEDDANTRYNRLVKTMAQNIECVYTDSGEEYYTKEYPIEDVIDFVEKLTEKQFIQINQFFETMPKVMGMLSFTCKSCGAKHKGIEVTGLQSFLE